MRHRGSKHGNAVEWAFVPARQSLITTKHHVSTVLVTVSLFVSICAWAQNKPKFIEITQQDLTKTDPLRSTDLAVFGLRLGQTEQEAEAIAHRAGFYWKKTALGVNQETPAASLVDANGQSSGILLRLTFGKVDRIDIYSESASRLVIDSAKLLSDDILEPTSSTRMALLGHEDEYQHHDLQLLGEWREFHYFKEGIEIDGIRSSDKVRDLRLSLLAPAKVR